MSELLRVRPPTDQEDRFHYGRACGIVVTANSDENLKIGVEQAKEAIRKGFFRKTVLPNGITLQNRGMEISIGISW